MTSAALRRPRNIQPITATDRLYENCPSYKSQFNRLMETDEGRPVARVHGEMDRGRRRGRRGGAGGKGREGDEPKPELLPDELMAGLTDTLTHRETEG